MTHTLPPSAPPRAARRLRTLAVLTTVTALAVTILTPTAAAAPDPAIPVVDGKTAPFSDYASAIRERVFIPVDGVDQDLDGVTDVTAIDIIRPAETADTLRVPAIIDPSPYYTTVGRGNEAQRLQDLDGDGVTDLFPLFYDNYFVPRGYAVIHAQMNGTGFSTGCPMHGGAGDIQSMKVVIDWLNGRVAGYDGDGVAVTADWHTGKSAMIGKSYDGTLANGVAATGVEGLTTIVPIDAISDWYRYSRTNGIRHNTNYPSSLANTVTNPDRRALCAPTRTTLSEIDGDETGDYNAFWDERDYTRTVDAVTASVFAVHGLNDDNVRMSQFADYWQALAEHDVPRKVWLPRLGHIDPFDFRRDVWVDTLHRWYDYWLHGIENGIMSEPQSTVEFGPAEYVDEASWPAPSTEYVDLSLSGTASGTPGSLAFRPVDGASTLQIVGGSNSPSETSLANNPEATQSNRLVLLSEPLAQDLRISGTPVVQLDASLSQEQSNLSALLIDYSTATRTPRSPGDGIQTLTERTCWGAETPYDSACYLETARRSSESAYWRVSRGVLDSSNRESFAEGAATVVTPGAEYDFDWKMEPYDHVFRAGSRIGVVLSTNLSGFTAGSPGATVTLDAVTSSISLPVVGGTRAAFASGAFGVPIETVRPQTTLVSPTTAGPLRTLEIQVDATDDIGLDAVVANIYQSGKLVKSTQTAGNGATSVSHTATVALPDGTYQIRYNARDAAGNLSLTRETTVTLDATAPTVTVKSGDSFTKGADGTYSLVSFKLHDAGMIDRLTLNGVEKDLTNSVWSDLNYVKPGTFGGEFGENTLVVHDVAGNTQTVVFVLTEPAWSAATVYGAGDTVWYSGSTWLATWYAKGQPPGQLYGPWQEIRQTTDGTAVWTPTRIFVSGDVVEHDGVRYTAKWWTRNQVPGDPNGPWARQG
ncbi:CocE/NonD family hydrolase [Microbacterium awajiense]